MKEDQEIKDYLTELVDADDAKNVRVIGDRSTPPETEPEQMSSISEYRLANLFARNRREQEILLVAFRRALSGQHLTLEFRILLTDQLIKVLHAARSNESKLMHLRILLGDQTLPSENLPTVHEALDPKASSALLRLSRVLDPGNANMLKIALQMLEEGKRLDVRRIRMIVEAFTAMLSVFEAHPEMITLLKTKQRDLPSRDQADTQQQIGSAPAMGT